MIHIIGAGPIGLYLAYKIKEEDSKQKVVVYEEHEKIGEPIQCTGLVTSMIAEFVKVPRKAIANKIGAAQILAPNKKFIEVKLKKPDLVVYRNKFDQYLEDKAANAGVKIIKNRKLKKIKKNLLVFESKEVKLKKDDVVIGADGPNSVVAKHLDVKHDNLQGIQAVMSIKNNKRIKFYPHIGEYAWFVPENSTTARVGVAARKHAKPIFDEFIKAFKGKVLEKQAGLIPLYSVGSKCYDYKDNVYYFLIGDAAGHLKNTTGGGLIPGLRCAEALSELIITKQHWRYPLACMMQKDLMTHYLLHKAFTNFNDNDWNEIIGEFNQKELKSLLAKNDREHAFTLVFKILAKKPGLAKYIKRIL